MLAASWASAMWGRKLEALGSPRRRNSLQLTSRLRSCTCVTTTCCLLSVQPYRNSTDTSADGLLCCSASRQVRSPLQHLCAGQTGPPAVVHGRA